MKKAKDESKKHENKESMKMEGKETMMEKKGYKETTSGKMVKAAKGTMTKSQKKIGKVMREFKKGKLHSGKSKKIVSNPKQAVAIALSEAGKSKLKVKKAAMGSMMNWGKGQSKFSRRQGMQQPQQGLAGMPGIRTLPVSQPQQPGVQPLPSPLIPGGFAVDTVTHGMAGMNNPSLGGLAGAISGYPLTQQAPMQAAPVPTTGGLSNLANVYSSFAQQPQMAKKGKMMKAASGDLADSTDRLTENDVKRAEVINALQEQPGDSEIKSRYLEKAQRMLGEPNLKEAMGPADKRSIVDKGKDLFRNVKEKIKQDPGIMGTGDPKRLMRKKGGGIAIAGMGAAYKTGGSVQARGVKLARTKPTKLF